MRAQRWLILLALLSAAVVASAGSRRGPSASYRGQPLPAATARLFARGLVNAGMPTRDAAFTPDGRELYFSVYVPGFTQAAILVTRLSRGHWTAPEVAPFAQDSRYRSIEPCIAPNGGQFFFASDRPEQVDAKPVPMGIWVMERTQTGWGAPRRLGPEVNGDGEAYFPSLTADGTLYFTREAKDGTSAIYRARPSNGGYSQAERLPDRVNCGKSRYNAFVAPDESYVIVPAYGLEDSLGGTDYYITFRRSPDQWSEPRNLGATINSPSNDDYSPFVTRDGRFFFFMSMREDVPRIPAKEKLTYRGLRAVSRRAAERVPGLYWIDAGFIEVLRKQAVFR
jgi:hypothetical protein